MKIVETALPGVFVIEPRVYSDVRGFFCETYREESFRAHGIEVTFVQDNHSRSTANTLRGLHYQLRRPQAKLCRVVRGTVLDVVADIRRGSPTFGRYESVVLSEDNHRQVFIPRGYAHAFLVLSECADFLYKCDDYYFSDDNYGVAWDDPQLGIDWGAAAPVLSEKDATLPNLVDVPPESLPVFRA